MKVQNAGNGLYCRFQKGTLVLTEKFQMSDELKNYQSGDMGNPFASGAGQVGYENYKRRQQQERDRLRKGAASGTGSSSGGGLGLIALAGIGIVWWNWNEIVAATIQSANGLVEVTLQNWFVILQNLFWVSAFPIGIVLLLLGFAKRAHMWKIPSKRCLVPEFLMLLGLVLLVTGKIISGYQSIYALVFWFSPIIVGIAAALVLYFCIFARDQPKRFAIKRHTVGLIKDLAALPLLATFMGFVLVWIFGIIAVFGFNAIDPNKLDLLEVITIAYGISWPLSYYWASKQGYIKS